MISRHTFRKISILVLCIINLIFFIFEAYAGTVDTATLSPSSATIQTGQLQTLTFSATNDKTFDLNAYHAEFQYTTGLNISNLIATPQAAIASIDLTNNLIILEWGVVPQGVALTATFDVSSQTQGTYSISPSNIYYKYSYTNPKGLLRTKTVSGTCNSAEIIVQPGGTPTGAIEVKATLDGVDWNGLVNYTLNGPENINGNATPATFSEKPIGTYALTYDSGGPPGATLIGISPLDTQTLNAGGEITFTMNFTSLPIPLAPSNLLVSAVSSDKITISWMDNSDNETGFKIERKDGSSGTYIQISTVGVDMTRFTDT